MRKITAGLVLFYFPFFIGCSQLQQANTLDSRSVAVESVQPMVNRYSETFDLFFNPDGGIGGILSIFSIGDPPSSVLQLAEAITVTTSINISQTLTQQYIGSPNILRYPIATMVVYDGLDITSSMSENMKHYIDRGGFLIVDNLPFADGPNAGYSIIRDWLRKNLPRSRIYDIPQNHQIFSAYFKIVELPTGIWAKRSQSDIPVDYLKKVELVEYDGRIVAVLIGKGYFHAWDARRDSYEVPELRFVMNTVFFALSQPGGMVSRAETHYEER